MKMEVFNNVEFGRVRTIEVDNDVWFVVENRYR